MQYTNLAEATARMTERARSNFMFFKWAVIWKIIISINTGFTLFWYWSIKYVSMQYAGIWKNYNLCYYVKDDQINPYYLLTYDSLEGWVTTRYFLLSDHSYIN